MNQQETNAVERKVVRGQSGDARRGKGALLRGGQSFGLALSLGLLSVSTLAGCKREAQDDAAPRPAASVRAEPSVNYARPAAYDVSVVSESDVGQGQNIRLNVTGKLEAHQVQRVGARVELALRLRDARAQSGGGGAGDAQDLDAISRELNEPFFITLEAGRMQEVRLAKDLSAVAANLQRTLGSAFQVASAPSAVSTWKTFESDATGKYEVQYTAVNGAGIRRFDKKKLRYESLVAGKTKLPSSVHAKSPNLDLAVDVTAFEGSLELDKDGSLVSVAYTERLEAKLLQGAAVASKTSFSVKRLGAAQAADAPKETDYAGKLIHLVDEAPYPAASPIDLDAQRTAGLAFDQVVAELEAAEREWKPPEAAKQGQVESESDAKARGHAQQLSRRFVALEAIFRKQPATIPLAVAKIRAGSPAAAVLANALGSSEAPGAQAALLKLAGEGRLSESLRQSAATSLIRTEHPTEEAVATLTRLASDPVVGVHAIYGLGSFARKLRASAPQKSEEVSKLLLTRLAQAPDNAQKIHVLRGIANSGYVGALPAVRPHLASTDPVLRSAAIEALRLMQGDEVNKLVAASLSDERASVRNAALGTARVRPASPELVSAVEKVATSARDGYGRMEAVRLLGTWMPQKGGVRETLARIAKEDAEPRIREVAQKLVGG